VQYREADTADAEPIAELHADSWRRSYRGAYSDAFLDGDVFADRLEVWRQRLTPPRPEDHTVVAEHEGELVGFVHTTLDDDPTWGALLDNLHVAHGWKRKSIGTRLMESSARRVVDHAPGTGMYLWVLEQNEPARTFYEARRGTCVGREESEVPGGGSVIALRYVWRDPAVLFAPGGT
jgi:GNAT superfamily N-acetyltransferase